MKPPHLAIIGSTSVGKSDCAFATAKEIGIQFEQVFIISVDSRQVYKGLEILSGCDIPPDYARVHDESICCYDFFRHENISLFGLSCVEVWDEWSMTHFNTFASKLYDYAVKNTIPVIFVGGTGLYYEHLFSKDPSLFVPPNYQLREELENTSTSELLALLAEQHPGYVAQLNNSDAHNRRRLVRALERAAAGVLTSPHHSVTATPLSFVGLKASHKKLEDRIAYRVRSRLTHGVVEEVVRIRAQHPSPQVITALGYEQCQKIADGEASEEHILSWIRSEIQYARRQETWWKKHQQITWFETADPTWFLQFKKHVGI